MLQINLYDLENYQSKKSQANNLPDGHISVSTTNTPPDDKIAALSDTLNDLGLPGDATVMILEQARNASFDNPRLRRWSPRYLTLSGSK